MKAKMYQTQNGLIYRAEGNAIQVMNPQVNDEWRESAVMMDIARKSNLTMQEALDRKAAMSSWKPWKPPESAQEAQSNAVQLAAILADRYKRSGGEMTAEKFKKFLGTGGYGDPDLGDIEYDYKGVSIRPEPQRWTREMKFTWAKFIKFCRDNGLIEEKSLKSASKPVSEQAEEADAPLNKKCKTVQSPSGHCGAAACCVEPYECCAQCPKDCNARCGWISAKEENICTKPAPKPAAAATTVAPVVATSEETLTTSESAAAESSNLEPSPSISTAIMSGPASPAGAGAAAQSLSAAAPASSEVLPLDSSAFDYTGLDDVTVDTLHLAERIIRTARQKYIVDLAGAVDMAHEELVRNSDGHNQHSEDTFIAWCRSVGISKTTAYQLLQVQTLISGSTPEEQAVLEAASPSLLYAAAKPSAPAQLVEGVKSGDITTHKQYQELLAQLKAKEQELEDEKASRKSENAAFSELLADEQQRRQEAEQARIAAEKSAQGAKESYRVAQKNEMLQIQRAKDAENQRAMMEEREQIHLARIAELEARPVEVVGADPDEIERRAKALADEKTAALKAELEKERSISEDLAGKLAEANMSLEDSQQENTDALLLAGVRRTVSLCSMLLAEEFERLSRVDNDDLYEQAVNDLDTLLTDLDQAIGTGRWPDEKDGEED